MPLAEKMHRMAEKLLFFAFSLTFLIFSHLVVSLAGDSVSVITFPGGIRAAIPHPTGWTGLPDGTCLVSPAGKKFCGGTSASAGMEPCQSIEAEARQKDAPGDPDVKIYFYDTLNTAAQNQGVEAACAARIVSPRSNSIFFRAVYGTGGKSVSLFSEPFTWNTDLDKDSLPEFEKTVRDIFGKIAFSGSADFAALVPESFSATGRPNFQAVKSAAPSYQARPRTDALLAADKLRLTGKIAEAEAAYGALRESFPYDSEIGLGDIALAHGNADSAKGHYNLALSLDSSLPDAYNGLGSVVMLLSDFEKAESYFKQAQERDPGNPGSFANLGWLNFVRGRYVDAEKNFMEALARDPDPETAAAATNGLTEISFRYNDPAAAVEWNRQLLIRFSDFAEAHANMVRALLALGRTDDAVREAETLLALRSGNPGAELIAGRAFFAAEKYPESAAHLCPWLDAAGAAMSDRLMCADALDRTGRTQDSLAMLRALADSDKATPEVFLMLGAKLARDGDTAAASAVYKKGMERFSDSDSLKKAADSIGNK